MTTTAPEDRDPEVLDEEEPSTTIALRMKTLPELALMRGTAIEVVETIGTIVATLRRASIRATHPEDWVLFRTPEGQVTAYCQDCGTDRVRDLWGVEVFDVSKPEKIVGSTPGEFHYLISGSGRSRFTGQVVEAMEGGRSSTEDFCKGLTGVELELKVRKAARANLDGGITRELTGMKSVPVQELTDAWVGTSKTVDRCHKGRGFGTRDQRQGGEVAPDAGIDPPICRNCKRPMVLRKGQKGDFYSCPNYKDHGKDSYTVDAKKWIEEQRSKTPTPTPTPAKVDVPPAEEVFNGRREPGEEG